VKTHIVYEAQFADLQLAIAKMKPGFLVIDTETDSVSERTAKLHGIGLSFEDDVAYYLPIRDNKKALIWSNQPDLAWWLRSLVSMGWKLIGHNIVYDILVLENNLHIHLAPFIHSDTILQKHTINEERPFGLKEVAVQYLGHWADKAQQALYANIEKNGGKTTQEQMDMWCADLEVLAEYCCWDVLLTRKLFHLFEAKLLEEGVHELFYKDEIMPLYREVTIDMKRRGFYVDIPHFQSLKTEIETDLERYENEVMAELNPLVEEFVVALMNSDVPVKPSGDFPKVAANLYEIPVPINKKTGKVTLAAKEVQKLLDAADEDGIIRFYEWILGEEGVEFPFDPRPVQEAIWRKRNPEKKHVFNLNSGDHMRWLLFTKLELEPLGQTETGKDKVDADTLEEMADQHPVCDKIIDFKKLGKLKSTYIDGVIDRAIDSVIYTSMLQFGTTSGRYSSRNPNCQNLPRLKDEESKLSPLVLKYTNAIRKGFVAPKGYVLVNADYSSLEPVCFAHMSGDEKLRDVFRRGWDLYSAIAIDVWGLHEYSADKKADNYLGKHRKEVRQKAKIFCLAVVYGAEAGRISKSMDVSYEEAQQIIDKYLDAYPNLRDYMDSCRFQATRHGKVISSFGRIRHLPQAQRLFSLYGKKLLNRQFAKQQGVEDLRYTFKNSLNLSMNFPIQGLAAHIVNRAMIATSRAFKQAGIDAAIILQVHDEITCVARQEHATEARIILKKCMEHTTTISVPLAADPVIATNWAEAK
jgi:DNA polymerase I-like protein with 3'-5' exonuclease and polymerase domains